jgi:fumarylpyruvate hydrolase
MDYVFPPAAQASVAVVGSDARFPVHRIYCVGRNYAAHVREMGGDPNREAPFFFSKPADAVVASGASIAYPSRTADLHHEIELVVAIGKGGRDIAAARALEHVFGYAVGVDLTRRDLQAESKKAGRPWDTSKGFDQSALIGAIKPAESGDHPQRARIWLSVNGAMKQQGDLADLIWSVPEVLAELSTFFHLAPGDLIYTGTPEGVGALKPGDRLEGGIDGIGALSAIIVASVNSRSGP